MGAYDAAARDARRALEYEGVSSSRSPAATTVAKAKTTPTPYHPAPSSSDGATTTTMTAATTLRAGALCALGYSLLRRGCDPDGSAASFEEAASLARWGLDETTGGPASTSALRDVLTRATSGSSSLKQCRALRSRLRSDEHDVEALDAALLLSPGDVDMHLSRVEALVRHRRWSDVANRIEQLAARAAGWEGTFRDCGGRGAAGGDGGGGDDDRLSEVDPLLASTSPPLGMAYVDFLRGREGMPALEELRPDFFDDRPEDHVGDGVDDDGDRRRAAVPPPHLRTLGPKAARDAVFRIPGVLLPHYLRALRLEERYAAATMAGSALSDFIDRANVVEDAPPATNDVLRREFDKLDRTIRLKEGADSLFRDGFYDRALPMYGQCLAVDGGGGGGSRTGSILRQSSMRSAATVAANPAGGRLHAVLHFNRAACFSAMGRHEDAIKESSHALEIHPTYMKAILRRAKCHAKVGRNDGARVDYERYVRLVEDARREQRGGGRRHPRANQGSACYFDMPSDVSQTQLEAVKCEMNSLVDEKPPARREIGARRTRTRGITRIGRDRRRSRSWIGWLCCKKSVQSQVATQSSSHPPTVNNDAPRRRKVSFSLYRATSSSESTISPPPRSFPPRPPKNDDATAPLVKSRPAFDRPLDPPSAIDTDVDYYAVLGLAPDASETDVKRAYHALAMKYHPDRNKSEDSIARFQDVTLAHSILADTKGKKREYDKARKGVLDP
jgi:tetratricopeptide (TPR) repeat protein